MKDKVVGFFYKGISEEGRPQCRVFHKGYLHHSDSGLNLWAHFLVYNQQDISELVSGTGRCFEETLAYLYRKEGVSGFRRLNGRFTIIITEGEKTIIVRDRNGEGKMIYYTSSFFTDSYKKILDLNQQNPEPSIRNIATFLSYGYIPAPLTALKGVFRVPAGGVLTVTPEGISLHDLFDFEEILQFERSQIKPEEAVEVYCSLLKQSLIRRIGKAESAGVLLSGGLDSGGNLSILREIFSGKIKTFTVGFMDNPASEADCARRIASQSGSEHHEYLVTGNELEELPSIIDAMGDPFAESGVILNYSALLLLKNHDLPVVLGGDANDQYFGAGIRETALHYQLFKNGFLPVMRFVDKISENDLFDNDDILFRTRYHNSKILRVMEPERFGFNNFHLKKMFGEPSSYKFTETGSIKSFNELFLKRNYYLHLCQTTNDVIIHKAARLSDFMGINLSFTYTDLDLWNFIQHLPLNLRASGSKMDMIRGKGVSKYLHKQLMKSRLPAEVTRRCKQGGFSPLEMLFKDYEKRQIIYRYILKSEFTKYMADKGFLISFFRKYDQMMTEKPYWFWYRQVKSNQLFNLLVLAVWWDQVILNKRNDRLSDYLNDNEYDQIKQQPSAEPEKMKI